MPSKRHSRKKRNTMETESSKTPTVLSTPECTCEASSSCISGPSSNSCELHRSFPDSEIEFYEQMEQLRDQEYKMKTSTHEKRMKYFRTEMVEYLQETEWKYKPIEHYIKF